MQPLKGSQLFHRGQTLPDLGEVRADSLDEGVSVTTLAELAQKVAWFLVLLVKDEAGTRDEGEGQELAIEGEAGLTKGEKGPEGEVRDRGLEVSPESQRCECTEAGDLL